MTRPATSREFQRPRVPFADSTNARLFGKAVLQKLTKRLGELRAEYVSPQNISFFPHGHGWTFQQERAEGFAEEEGAFKKHSTEVSVHDDRILANDFSLVDDVVGDLAQKMTDTLVKGIIREMDDTCQRFDRITNVPKGSSLADGILATLSDIQASVDEKGEVSLPRMMMSPELIERLQPELLIREKELKRKFAEVRAQNESDARAREAERIAKFDRE